MSIEERLAAAERRIEELERRGMSHGPFRQLPLGYDYNPFGVSVGPRCSCPPGTSCMNVACPMRPQVTCGPSSVGGVA